MKLCVFEDSGVEFLEPPTTADWGSSAIFRDPDGNQFVLGSK